jgi:hypothetical protein
LVYAEHVLVNKNIEQPLLHEARPDVIAEEEWLARHCEER